MDTCKRVHLVFDITAVEVPVGGLRCVFPVAIARCVFGSLSCLRHVGDQQVRVLRMNSRRKET